jgi:anthranilate synthase component 1
LITYEQFQQQAAEGHTPGAYNLIPVVREVLSDLDTPLSVYLKLADGPYTYLFESVEGGERFGRYSIIGLPARRVYSFRGNTLEISELGEVVERREVADPLAEVEALRARHAVPKLEGLPGFTGGLVGWFGFECIQYIEPRLAAADKPDELGTPDILLMLSEELAVFDNLKGRLYLIVHVDPGQPQAYARANRRLDELSHRLRQAGAGYPQTQVSDAIDEADFRSSFTREQYHEVVRKAQEYVRAGDIFQVVPSQRLRVPFRARPIDVYRALRALNPSPYMYFVDVGGTQVVGSSPEILARLRDGVVTVRPIAGTRPRGATPELDLALEAELLADPKERAEHVMLIDLGRNDVGRVAEPGTVTVNGRAEDPRAGDHSRTGAGTPQRLFRRSRLHRLAWRCRYRHCDPHGGDPGRLSVRTGRWWRGLRLRSGSGMAGNHEQGPRAVPRGGAGRQGAVMQRSGVVPLPNRIAVRCALAAED